MKQVVLLLMLMSSAIILAMDSGKLKPEYTTQSKIKLSPRGDQFLGACYNQLMIFNTHNGKPCRVLEDSANPESVLQWSERGRYIINRKKGITYGKNLQIWDAADGKKLHSYCHVVKKHKMSPNEQLLAVFTEINDEAGIDEKPPHKQSYTLHLVNTANCEENKTFSLPDDYRPRNTMTFSGDSKYFVFLYNDFTTWQTMSKNVQKVIATARAKEVAEIEGDLSRFTPSSDKMVVRLGEFSNQYKVYETTTFSPIATYQNGSCVDNFKIVDDKLVAVKKISYPATYICDVASGNAAYELKAKVSASGKTSLSFKELEGELTFNRADQPAFTVRAIVDFTAPRLSTVSGNDNYLAVYSEPGTIALYETEHGTLIAQLDTKGTILTDIAFSKNNEYLLVESSYPAYSHLDSDSTLKRNASIWNIKEIIAAYKKKVDAAAS